MSPGAGSDAAWPGPPGHDRCTGTVAEFDEQRGTGVVEADDGRRMGFHCTAIADGSRRIAAAARVSFAVGPGPLGRWEARDIRPDDRPANGGS